MLFLIVGTMSFGRQFSHLGIRIEEITVYVTELVLIATWVLIFLRKVVTKEMLFKKSPLNLLFLFYYAIGLLCLLRGLPDFGMEALRHSVIVYYSLFYFLILELVTDTHQLERFLKYSLIASVVALLVIFYNFASGVGLTTSTGVVRYGANTQALSLAFCFFFWLSLSIFKIKCKAKSFLKILIPFQIFAALFLIQHRSLPLAMIGGLVFIFALINKTRTFKYIVLALCGFLLILSIDYLTGILSTNILLKDTLTRASTILTPEEDPNSLHRLAMWGEVLNRTARKPLVGEGFGAPFSIFFGSKSYDYSERRLHPHNSFLWILNRMGIVGFGILFFLILKFYSSAIKAYKSMSPGKSKAYLLALMSCHVCICIFAFFNVVLEGPFMGIFFWIIMGLTMALININKNELGENKYELKS
ncbi:MAG: O-antigen ligase family protein [candidate division Zixibacteria bacterium]|nr:O-antigen ligase family protein [candidate division Zixibacteria bacterium]